MLLSLSRYNREIALSDSAGNVMERYSYDVFGEPNRVSKMGNPYMFTGRRYDSETGLYYYRARYYDPYIGRFLQRELMTFTSQVCPGGNILGVGQAMLCMIG